MQVHRDKEQIMHDILKILGDGGMPKTRLMMMAIMSWNQLSSHLSSMEQLQLIRHAEDPDRKFYLTDKGEQFIKKYDKLMKIFDTKNIES